MKKILILFIVTNICINAYSQNNRKCVDCYGGALPVFNGVNPAIPPINDDINTANVFVDSSTMVITNDSSYVLKAKIKCKRDGGNNAAWGVRVTVLLPAEVKILEYSGSNGCLITGLPIGVSDNRINTGYLIFEQESLQIDDSFEIIVKTSKPTNEKAKNKVNFGVFAYNRSADPILCDNFWYWRQVVPALCTNCKSACNLADLSFGNVTIDWANKKVTAVIHNNGAVAANNFYVYFDGDESPRSNNHLPQVRKLIASLAAGASRVLTADFNPISHSDNANLSRIFQITIRIDPKQMVSECLESDNVLSKRI
jgi:hypothetical protein